jgi:methylated-DNA-protein-cysteine methyltransferase-like protein
VTRPATRDGPHRTAPPRRSDFARAVVRVVRRVPYGRVISYGGVAAMAGRPRAARAVGSVMQALPDEDPVPWWRVINAQGGISPGGSLHRAQVQRALLEAEGVRFGRQGRVDWERYGWQ